MAAYIHKLYPFILADLFASIIVPVFFKTIFSAIIQLLFCVPPNILLHTSRCTHAPGWEPLPLDAFMIRWGCLLSFSFSIYGDSCQSVLQLHLQRQETVQSSYPCSSKHSLQKSLWVFFFALFSIFVWAHLDFASSGPYLLTFPRGCPKLWSGCCQCSSLSHWACSSSHYSKLRAH